jgi:hypothetical protein
VGHVLIGLEGDGAFGELNRLGRALEETVAEDEVIDARVNEAAVGVVGGADDGFAADVEGGIDEDGAAGGGFEAFEEGVEAGVLGMGDGLDAGGEVDVGDGGDGGSGLFEAIEAVEFVRDGEAEGGLDLGDEEHVRGIGIELEVVVETFESDDGSEGAEGLALFDFEVEVGLDGGGAWVGEDGTIAESAGAEFHAALEPGDDVVLLEELDGAIEEIVVVELFEDGVVLDEGAADLVGGIFGAEQGGLHGVGGGIGAGRRVGKGSVMGDESGAEGAAGVTGSGLDPEAVEGLVLEDFAIGDAVQGDAAGEA